VSSGAGFEVSYILSLTLVNIGLIWTFEIKGIDESMIHPDVDRVVASVTCVLMTPVMALPVIIWPNWTSVVVLSVLTFIGQCRTVKTSVASAK